MAKKNFWEVLKDLFRDEDEHIITDEEWAEMQAEERRKREELLLDDEPLEVDNRWKCPVCHRYSPEDAVFCVRWPWPGRSWNCVGLVLSHQSAQPRFEAT